MAIFCPFPGNVTGIVGGALIAALGLIIFGILVAFGLFPFPCLILGILSLVAFLLGLAIVAA